ncbi:hypothetical protein ACJ72_03823 [Emergomyces africanus]|uniref:Uncharacterized protein n=1 Tax=Emergomyces africanus TaxID=1955775 RepID=A0A1B7NYL1_9EURO|nr:hypothetical protein ACJ72_03823 [Emergomyces africanus]
MPTPGVRLNPFGPVVSNTGSRESEYPSLEYMPSNQLPSSPLQSDHRVSTRSHTACASIDTSPSQRASASSSSRSAGPKPFKRSSGVELDHQCPKVPLHSMMHLFKFTCAAYGYTVVGKETTSGLWKHGSCEAEICQVLQKAQSSADPVLLGMIDLKPLLFLHDAGDIRHMLLVG